MQTIPSYFSNMSNLLNYSYNNCYIALYPEFFLILVISGLIAFLVVLDQFYNYKLLLSSITAKILIACLFLTLILLNNLTGDFFVFNNLLIVDNFTILIKNISLISLIFIIFISIEYIKHENFFKYEYFLLLGLAALGMLTIISSNDLITMYLGIEIQSLCFYILATIKIYNNFSTEAGLKYFILGAFSSGMLLFGSSFIYGSLGTTNFSEMKLLFNNFSELTDNPKSLILGILFVIVAILFKIGAVPFHM
jgi:proton-translocating NADH-quinone oxidoreductase chain N